MLCIETFEHVFEVSKAFDEVFRLLKPGGIFVITSPLNFRIHGYPDDYWRMTPNCLRAAARALRRAAHAAIRDIIRSRTRSWGSELKAPVRARLPGEAGTCRRRVYGLAASATRSSLPVGEKLRRRISQIYRSKGERHQIAGYYAADFTIDLDPTAAPGLGASGRAPARSAAI